MIKKLTLLAVLLATSAVAHAKAYTTVADCQGNPAVITLTYPGVIIDYKGVHYSTDGHTSISQYKGKILYMQVAFAQDGTKAAAVFTKEDLKNGHLDMILSTEDLGTQCNITDQGAS